MSRSIPSVRYKYLITGYNGDTQPLYSVGVSLTQKECANISILQFDKILRITAGKGLDGKWQNYKGPSFICCHKGYPIGFIFDYDGEDAKTWYVGIRVSILPEGDKFPKLK